MEEIRVSTVHSAPGMSWDRIYTRVEEDGHRWCSDIPEWDFRRLLEIYTESSHEEFDENPVRFVLDIGSRIYSEWCMGEGRGSHHPMYQGEGFKSFVDRETHYELEKPKSQQDRGSHEGYLRAKDRVLGGLVERAVELFSEWGNSYPSDCFNKEVPEDKKDKRNLRVSLASYIDGAYSDAA